MSVKGEKYTSMAAKKKHESAEGAQERKMEYSRNPSLRATAKNPSSKAAAKNPNSGAAVKKPKPGTTRVSPLNTHLREMQAEARKRAQEKKIMRQMEQNHLKGGTVWDNGYTN